MFEYEVSWKSIPQSKVSTEARSPYKAYRAFLTLHRTPLHEKVLVNRHGEMNSFANHCKKEGNEKFVYSKVNHEGTASLLLLLFIFAPLFFLLQEVDSKESIGDIGLGYSVYCLWLLASFVVHFNRSKATQKNAR